MFFVNKKPFNDLLEAITYCKTKTKSTLTDSNGTVLMFHVQVPYETFRDIHLAKAVLEMQTS